MSSILKALKKVENDNASRRPDELRIDAEILRTENHSRYSSSTMLLVSLLLMVCGAGGTYLYMTRGKAIEQTNPNTHGIIDQKRQPVSAVPQIPAEQLPPAIIVVPAQKKIVSEGNKEIKQRLSIQEKGTPSVTKLPVVAEQPVLIPQRATPLPATQAPKTVPPLRVNGIAFQDDSSGTVAMINGEPHSKGGIVNGVKVEEIYKNRVKFSYSTHATAP